MGVSANDTATYLNGGIC